MIRRRQKTEPETRASAPKTSGWTQGSVIASKAGYIVLAGCLLAGPAAIGLHFLDQDAPVAVATTDDRQAGLTISEQTAGAVATGYVAAWLSATRDDPSGLKSYISIKSLTLPEAPTEYRDLRLVSVTPDESQSMASVTVAVAQQASVVDGEKTTTLWAPRFYQVLTQLDADRMRVVGLPAPIAAPAAPEDTLALQYPESVSSTQGVGQAAAVFLTAYLTGEGELDRLISPTSTLTAVTPAPYTAVRFVEIRADRNPEGTPTDGDQARVLVTVAGTTAGGAELTSTYALTSTARDGRWEIATIDLFPIVSK